MGGGVGGAEIQPGKPIREPGATMKVTAFPLILPDPSGGAVRLHPAFAYAEPAGLLLLFWFFKRAGAPNTLHPQGVLLFGGLLEASLSS